MSLTSDPPPDPDLRTFVLSGSTDFLDNTSTRSLYHCIARFLTLYTPFLIYIQYTMGGGNVSDLVFRHLRIN